MKYDLKGNFHCHITYTTNKDTNLNFEVYGWKNTIITLNKDDVEQTDVMITKHYKLGSEKTPDYVSIIKNINDAVFSLEGYAVDVVRVKLEHESLPTLKTNQYNYRECHIKIMKPKSDFVVSIPGFVQSRNPMEVTGTHSTVFLNARFYDGDVDSIDRYIDASVKFISTLNPHAKILEVKKETCIEDTNLNLDKWWA